jgi:hypothetical protein
MSSKAESVQRRQLVLVLVLRYLPWTQRRPDVHGAPRGQAALSETENFGGIDRFDRCSVGLAVPHMFER